MNEITTTPHEPTAALAPTTPRPMSENPAAVYLAGLANDKARRVQAHALRVVAEVLTHQPDVFAVDWSRLDYGTMVALRTHLADRYAFTTANRTLSAVRGTLKAAFLLGLMDAERYQRAIMVENVTGENIPAGRELSSGEIFALMDACENDPTPAGRRDAAIIAIGYAVGLRREEIVNLDVADYDAQNGRLVVRGKRNKTRAVYVVNGAASALDDWLVVRGAAPGPLFFPVDQWETITARRMTTQAIYGMLAKRAGEAGVSTFSPHDLRRTCVSDLLDAGADLATVSKLVGHASVNTTARYDRRPETAKKKAASLLHVPYRGKPASKTAKTAPVAVAGGER